MHIIVSFQGAVSEIANLVLEESFALKIIHALENAISFEGESVGFSVAPPEDGGINIAAVDAHLIQGTMYKSLPPEKPAPRRAPNFSGISSITKEMREIEYIETEKFPHPDTLQD